MRYDAVELVSGNSYSFEVFSAAGSLDLKTGLVLSESVPITTGTSEQLLIFDVFVKNCEKIIFSVAIPPNRMESSMIANSDQKLFQMLTFPPKNGKWKSHKTLVFKVATRGTRKISDWVLHDDILPVSHSNARITVKMSFACLVLFTLFKSRQ